MLTVTRATLVTYCLYIYYDISYGPCVSRPRSASSKIALGQTVQVVGQQLTHLLGAPGEQRQDCTLKAVLQSPRPRAFHLDRPGGECLPAYATRRTYCGNPSARPAAPGVHSRTPALSANSTAARSKTTGSHSRGGALRRSLSSVTH